MLHALAFHACSTSTCAIDGDLEVDEHHTVEDCGIALGQALDRALGDRAGIRRFGRRRRAARRGARAPPSSTSAGRGVSAHRPRAVRRSRSAAIAASLWPHLLDSFARAGRVNAPPARRAATDDHHVVEAAFKALALALRAACAPDPRRGGLPSTKGAL